MADPVLADRLPGRSLVLLALGAGLSALYLGILTGSGAFTDEEPGRPILEMVGLLTAATVLYFIALGVVFRQAATADRRALPIVLGYSLLFRLLLLFSTPVLEIDFYRYLWDGRVTLHGTNPYRYSPLQIEDADSFDEAPADLVALNRLSHQSKAIEAIFGRVHYRGVSTVYPPAAQVVFAAAAWMTPADAPAATHILILKAILIGFDLATLGLLVGLLRLLHLPAIWCLAYGWCPLVIKEIANSGHLDSIAVFFTVLAVYLLIAAVRNRKPTTGPECEIASSPKDGPRTGEMLLAAGAAASLAFGVLAKTYPLLLVPVAGAFLIARFHRRAAIALVVFAGIIVAGYLPFCGQAPSPSDSASANHPGSGLGTFLTQWETNDFLFMLVYHNLRRPDDRPARWFVRAPASWRTALHDRVLDPLRAAVDLSPKVNPAFLLSQILMGTVLLGLCLHWARQVYLDPEPAILLRCVFRTLVWGWLLSSVQNPWYLTWCLPFMVFDGRLAWFLLPGMAILYYVRFWIDERWGVGDTFDFDWVWLEYAPFLLLLAAESWRRPLGSPIAATMPDAAPA